jgi:kynurenine formamidase
MAADHVLEPYPEGFADLADRVRTWGRWGAHDERGMLNLVDDAAVRRGAACVVTGESIPVGLPLSGKGVQAGLIKDRENPRHRMVSVLAAPTGDVLQYAMNDDAIDLGTQVSTHWDALAHVSYRGMLYNGFPADTVTEAGAAHCGIDRVGALITRGVLLDVARARGVDRLEGAHPIGPDDLDAALALAGVALEPGDAVLLRTGQMQLFHAGDRIAYSFPSPGLTVDAAPWLHDHGVAALATDTLTYEVFPRRDLGPNGEHFSRADLVMPVHVLLLVEMGLLQGQNFDLEALAADCASDGRYTFFLAANPEPFVGGCGSMVNPVAVK